MLRARECTPTPYPFVSTFGLTIKSIKEFGGASTKKRLFVGQNIKIFEGDNFLTQGPTSITTHMPKYTMDQHPCTTSGEDNQLIATLALGS